MLNLLSCIEVLNWCLGRNWVVFQPYFHHSSLLCMCHGPIIGLEYFVEDALDMLSTKHNYANFVTLVWGFHLWKELTLLIHPQKEVSMSNKLLTESSPVYPNRPLSPWEASNIVGGTLQIHVQTRCTQVLQAKFIAKGFVNIVMKKVYS